MKLTILVVLAALFIALNALEAPSLFYIGYLWISVLYPSAFVVLPIPFSFIFGLCCVGALAFSKREKLGRFPSIAYAALAFALWVTCTSTWAVHPDAWGKWLWAIQSILLVAATPIFLRTRAQLEMGLIVTFSAYCAHVLTAGAKAILGTGGYDKLGTLLPTNLFLGETSTLALVAILTIPMANYVVRHSKIFEPYRGQYFTLALFAYVLAALMCVVGTSARTGVIALGALLLIGIKSFAQRAIILGAAALFFFFGQSLLPERSVSRFSTISTYQQDDSATNRIAAWKWGANYASEHPFGGGFNVYYTSQFDSTHLDGMGRPITEHLVGRAPHSVYFEVLGEQGYVGEFLYLFLIVGGLWGTYRLSVGAQSSKQGEDWMRRYARTLWVCIVVFCVGASFIGVAFQPILYVFLGLYCSLFRLAKGTKSTPLKFLTRPVANVAVA